MRHLKIILLAIFAICLSQTIAIKAKSVHLYDSRRPLPIDGALIVGKSHDGNTLFKLVSDEDGRFTIADENCTDSPLTLSIRRTGYRDLSFNVESCHKLADTLRMHSDANLNEVVVSQKRPLYTVKPDKYIYDVAFGLHFGPHFAKHICASKGKIGTNQIQCSQTQPEEQRLDIFGKRLYRTGTAVRLNA